MRSQKLTTIILIGMVLGIVVGWACNTMWPDPKTAKSIADYISLITDIFLRLIKMIIAPLLFSTLVIGIAGTGDLKAMGRIGLKAIIYFEIATTIASAVRRRCSIRARACGGAPSARPRRRKIRRTSTSCSSRRAARPRS